MMGFLNRKKRFDDVAVDRVERALRDICYHPSTWPDRVEYSRDEFLENLFVRYKSLLGRSLQEMMRLSFAGKQYDAATKSLGDWLDDSKVNVSAGFDMVKSLSFLVSNYSNLASVIDMRRQLKVLGSGVDCVYLSYGVPAEMKGAEMMYVFLDVESYELINDYLASIGDKKPADSSLYI